MKKLVGFFLIGSSLISSSASAISDEELFKACPAMAAKISVYKEAQAEIKAIANKGLEAPKNVPPDAKMFCDFLSKQLAFSKMMQADLRLCLPSFAPVVHESISSIDDAVVAGEMSLKQYSQTIGCP